MTSFLAHCGGPENEGVPATCLSLEVQRLGAALAVGLGCIIIWGKSK